ncbi:peptide ABC transporter substrate-binding protein|nr:peptide ABC transporter substrate-binding protein [Candidatus Pantoea persica]
MPQIAEETTTLPPRLTLHYNLPVELHEMVQALRQLMRYGLLLPLFNYHY